MKLEIRRYRPEDAAKIDEIYERCNSHFNRPDLNHCLELAVILLDGKIVACGAFQVIPEVILILDNEIPKRKQVEALKMLLGAGEEIAKLYDFPEFYAFSEDDKFSDILKKHFEFDDGNHILIKKVYNGE